MIAVLEPQKRSTAGWVAMVLMAVICTAGCTTDFTGPGGNCGDGVVAGSETCDDGNTASGDGCGASCRVEDGWTCSGEPSVCETQCGDGVARGSEACDGDDLRSLSCAELGLGGGDLSCGSGCTFDTTGCDLQAVCGNDAAEYPEDCDGTDLNDQTCVDLGFDAGDLACTPGCAFDTLGCVDQIECGDGEAEATEDCDGQDLAGETCEGLGLGSGTLRCDSDCVFDVGDCSGSATCGNATIEFPEVCDGASLGGASCQDQGFYGGVLACQTNCEGFDPAGCAGECGDGVTNGPEVCDGADLSGQTCADHGYYAGTLVCAQDCLSVVASGCSGECGDGVVGGPEQCDGADLNGGDCVSVGHYGGTLTCTASCDYDESACHQVPKIVINEVGHGWPDTVELHNLSAVGVDLQGWVLEAHGINLGGGTHVLVMDIPTYVLGADQRVLILDETTGNGSPPTVNVGRIQYHDNIQWGGGLSPGAAVLFNDVGVPLDFVRWGDDTFSPPPGTGWADTPNLLLAQAGDGITMSRVPEGVDSDTAADWCVTQATDGLPNGSCVDPRAGTTVLITEIDNTNPDRIELYNAGPLDVNLEGWTVYFYDDNGPEVGGTSLPAYALAVGEYVELIDNAGANPPSVTGDQIHIGNIAWTPPDAGGCGLVDPAGNGRDFVSWGVSASLPWAPDQFTDISPAPVPGGSFSLGRMSLTDTDTATEWCLQIPSFGSSNGNCQ